VPEIFILTVLRDKVVTYCETGVWNNSGFTYQTASQAAKARNRHILKEMRKEFQGYYISGLLRDISSGASGGVL
jgi:hypothetical protein